MATEGTIETERGGKSSLLFFAGALSGIVEAFTVQPFDMVKTTHQLNPGKNIGIFATLHGLYKEGGVKLWYRGMSAELAGMIPKSSVMFGTYGLAKKYLSENMQLGDTAYVSAMSGLIAGAPEAAVVTPAQIVKVRLQAKEHRGKYRGPIDCVRKIFFEEGVRGFTIGLPPTIWRNCIWNTIYFGTMHKVKLLFPKSDKNSHFENMCITFASGLVGAGFATCFNAPFDVVKSRMQSQLSNNPRLMSPNYSIISLPIKVPKVPLKYHSTIQSLTLILSEEGFASCYKGFRPKILRMSVGGAVAVCVYEFIVSLF